MSNTRIQELQARLEELRRQQGPLLHELFAEIRKNRPSQDQILNERRKARKEKYQTTNGLTIYGLRQAGNKVRVVHIRYMRPPTGLEEQPLMNLAVPVPTSLRHHNLNFLPNGGATYIEIVTPENKQILTSSICHEDDNFDYKMGVKTALDCLSKDTAEMLMSTLEAVVAG